MLTLFIFLKIKIDNKKISKILCIIKLAIIISPNNKTNYKLEKKSLYNCKNIYKNVLIDK